MVQGSETKMKSGNSEAVKVIVRCRPMDEQETKANYQRVVEMDVVRGVVEIRNVKNSETDPPKTFTFDAVYDWNSKQQDLYDETFRPLVDSVLSGFNGTIFAYGQTGTGKTYTMEGNSSVQEEWGVIPNSFDQIFNHIARSSNQQFLVRASYLEIYQEEIRDLLAKDQKVHLELKERPDTGVFVKDLQQFVCKSINEIQHVMTVGNQNRVVGATNMNLHSSRSHAIFIITIECSEMRPDGKSHITVGKLNLVDLAGSERQSKTGSVGDRLKEATKINLSLSALGNVISALVDGKSSHIPYRDSKLTRLLQDSLGGNSKTIMVANIGPASYNYDETLTTLRYANRAKNIKNKPKINEDPKDAILKEYQQEIARLKAQLHQRTGKKKKKKKKHSGEEEEEPEEEDGVGEDEIIQQQKKLEEEKESIINNQHLIEEEKTRLLGEVKNKEIELEVSKEAQDKLLNRISAMESKLLCGGKNIIDHTNEQQRDLEFRRHQIAEQKRIEREMLQRLEKEEENTGEIASTFSSLHTEVEAKTRKLKKLFAKLQSVKQETSDLHEEFCRDRADLQQTQDELTRELKLKALIIENFIPPEEKKKVLARSYFDEDEDIWKLKPAVRQQNAALKRPVSSASRRPMSEYARMQASVDHNPRYKGENIMAVELDSFVRTTREWTGPVVAPRVAAALEAALTPLEEDLDIDASIASLHKSNAVRSVRKGKEKYYIYMDLHKTIGLSVMRYFYTENQTWRTPPLPNAGQLSLSKVSWSRSQVIFGETCILVKSDSSKDALCSLTEDEYDEDPWDILFLRGLVARQIMDKENSSKAQCQSTSNSNSGSDVEDFVPTLQKPPIEKNKNKNRFDLLGNAGLETISKPFGTRRICYHYRPCVKRLPPPNRFTKLIFNPARFPLKKLRKKNSSFLYSSVIKFVSNSLPVYIRIFWRLSNSQWQRLLMSLTDNLGESVLLNNFTPVSFSLRHIFEKRTSEPPHLILSDTQDSFGAELNANSSDNMPILLLGCFFLYMMFIYRILTGLCSFVFNNFPFFSWQL